MTGWPLVGNEGMKLYTAIHGYDGDSFPHSLLRASQMKIMKIHFCRYPIPPKKAVRNHFGWVNFIAMLGNFLKFLSAVSILGVSKVWIFHMYFME